MVEKQTLKTVFFFNNIGNSPQCSFAKYLSLYHILPRQANFFVISCLFSFISHSESDITIRIPLMLDSILRFVNKKLSIPSSQSADSLKTKLRIRFPLIKKIFTLQNHKIIAPDSKISYRAKNV